MSKETTGELVAPQVLKGVAQVIAAFADHGIGKNRKNDAQGFTFRGIDDVLNRMSRHLVDANLVIIPKVTSREVHERTNARGNALFYVVLTVDYTIMSALDGSSVTITTIGEAMDSGDKATNKALSIAYKYMAFQTFAIPISDDPDSETHSVKPRVEAPSFPPSDEPDTTKKMGPSEVKTIIALCDEAGVSPDVIAKSFGAKSIEDVGLPNFAAIVDRLQSKIKSKKEK